jgi:diguanylate cyclase (GGDEF)-like protein
MRVKTLIPPLLAVVAAAATIAFVVALHSRAETAQSARVTLAQLETRNAEIESTRATLGLARAAPDHITNVLVSRWATFAHALAGLEEHHPLPQLAAVQRAMVVSHAADLRAERMSRLRAALRTTTAPHDVLRRALIAASLAYARRASATLTQAAWGSAIGVVALLGLFLLFYRRLQRAREESRRDALVDALTGLGNRRRLFQDLATARRQGNRALLVLCDLDGFKPYNDSFGHQAGDELLQTLGRRLNAAVAGIGAAYRMGGDEFCLLLLGPVDETDVRRIVKEAVGDAEDHLGVHMSYGVAVVGSSAEPAAAMRLADQRMYRDKTERREALSAAADAA